MLLSREEMTFDFGDARLDPVRDRELLVWIFNQFQSLSETLSVVRGAA